MRRIKVILLLVVLACVIIVYYARRDAQRDSHVPAQEFYREAEQGSDLDLGSFDLDGKIEAKDVTPVLVSELVVVANPQGIKNENRELRSGELCWLLVGGKVVVLSKEDERRLSIYATDAIVYGNMCPSGTMFIETIAREECREEDEVALVARLQKKRRHEVAQMFGM